MVDYTIDDLKERFDHISLYQKIGFVVILLFIISVVVIALNPNLIDNKATVNVEQTEKGVEVKLINMKKTEKVTVQSNDLVLTTLSENGDSSVIATPKGEKITVIGTHNNKKVTLETFTATKKTSEFVSVVKPGTKVNISGLISIGGQPTKAIVKSKTSTGKVVNSTEVNSDGTYSIKAPLNGTIIAIVNGSKVNTEYPLYASAERSVSSGSKINFTFQDIIVSTVDGNKIFVTSEISQPQYNKSTKTIGSIEQLQAIQSHTSSDYELITNINAQETQNWNGGNGFNPILLSGSFDGNRFTISNLTIDRGSDHTALFGEITNAKVSNVHITGANISGQSMTGVLVGSAYGNSSISNITITDSTVNSSKGTYIGGVIGQISGSKSHVNNIKFTGSIETSGRATGGAIGAVYKSEKIHNIIVDAKIKSSKSDVGGVIGYGSNTHISNTKFIGKIQSQGQNIGGIIGTLEGSSTLSNSIAKTSIDGGKMYIGGVVGKTGSSVSSDHLHADIDINSSASVSGGLIGLNNGDVSKSYAIGEINSKHTVGGLIGENTGKVHSSYSKTVVTSSTHTAGGLVGINTGTISQSYSVGDVTAKTYSLGGVVAINKGVVKNSYAQGQLEINKSKIGGVVGVNSGTVKYVYFAGDIKRNGSSPLVGEIIALNKKEGNMSHTYGDLSTLIDDLLVGSNRGSAKDVVGFETSEMTGSAAKENLSQFDFTSTDGDPQIWVTQDEKYPQLKSTLSLSETIGF